MLIILVLGLSLGAASEPLPVAEVLPLTLSEALELAEARNPDLQFSDQGIDVARSAIEIAGQRPNPTLGYAFPIGPAERKQRLILNIPLETGGRRKARLTVAEDGVKEAELSQLQARQALLNQTRNAFVELAVAQAALEQSRRDLEFFERLVDVAIKRFEAGDVAEAEIFRATFEKEQIERTLYPGQNRVDVALLNLNRLLGQSLETKLVLQDKEQVFPTETTLLGSLWEVPDLPTLQEMARDNRPDLALAAQQVETARHRIKLAKANQSPDLSLQSTLLYDPTFSGITYQVGVQVELPWRNKRRGEVSLARTREEQALLRHQALLATADHSVATAWTKFQNARQQLAHDLTVLRPQAGRVLELSEKIYELGLGDITEILLAGQSVQRQRQIFLADVAVLHQALGELELAVNSRLIGEQG